MPICSACGSDKANGEYSTNQRRKPDASRRCKACVGTPNNPNQQSGRQAPSATPIATNSGGTGAARPLGGAEGPAMEVDGSVMEGGGQVLRISTALASLLRRPVHVTKIRAGRSKPGLGNQHLAGITMVGSLCDADLGTATIGSTELLMTPSPNPCPGGGFSAEPGTCGSTCLILQAALPAALFAAAPCTLTIGGGTNTDFAPQIEYYTQIFFEVVGKMGVRPTVDIRRKGYFPKGGAEVVVTVAPMQRIEPLSLVDSGNLVSITGTSFTAGKTDSSVGKEMAEAATARLEARFPGVSVDIEVVSETWAQAVGPGSGIVLVGRTSTGCLLGGSGLGRNKKTSPARVGENAAVELMKHIEEKGCVDEWLADQLIIYMALAAGTSRVKTGPLSLHTKTAIYVVEQHTAAKFTVTPGEDGTNLVACVGIGFSPLPASGPPPATPVVVAVAVAVGSGAAVVGDGVGSEVVMDDGVPAKRPRAMSVEQADA